MGLIVSIVGEQVAIFLWDYVLTAGNILVTLIAFFAPLLTRNFIIPYLYHPYRYGGIPFQPPSFIETQMLYFFIITSMIFAFYLVSGYMAGLKLCHESDYQIVLYNYRKLFLPLLICFLLLTCFPLVKIPFLISPITIPYAEELINGLFWAIATFIGVVWANMDTTYKICGR